MTVLHDGENGTIGVSAGISNSHSDATVPFRKLIPGPDHVKVQSLQDSDAYSWCESKRHDPNVSYMVDRLEWRNIEKPYKGFTTDGTVKKDVFKFANNDGAPTEAMIMAVEGLLSTLSAEQKKETVFASLEVDEFRLWSNPELYINPGTFYCF